MRRKITIRSLEAMQPGDMLADTEVLGFVARCLPSGVVSYGLRYRDRLNSKRHWMRLGIHGEVTPDQARTLARLHLGEVAARENPLEAKRISAAKARGTDTVAHVLDTFVRRYVREEAKLRSGDDIEGVFNRIVKPAIGAKSIYELKRSDIVAMLDGVHDTRGPVMADRVLAHVRKAFNWYMGRDDAFISPVIRGMARTKPKERARDRKLSDDEIRQVWAALDTMNETFRALVRLLILTGQRRDEIARMRWDWLKDDTLEIPAQIYKTRRAHVVPLTPDAQTLIEAMPRYAGCPFVFTTNGKTPYSGFSKTKGLLDSRVNAARLKAGIGPIPPWCLNDLRRTARSLMSRAGVTADVAERVLGHAIPGVRGTYDRHDYLAEKRAALERLAAELRRFLEQSA